MGGLRTSGLSSPLVRTAALVALVVLVAVALRGYLPDAEPTPRREPESGLGSIIAVHVLLLISVGILIVGIVTTWREKKDSPRPVSDESSDRLRVRLGRKFVLYLAAIAAVFALFAVVASFVTVGIDRPGESRESAESDGGSTGNQRATQPVQPEEPEPPQAMPTLVVLGAVLLLVAGAGVALAVARSRPSATTMAVEDSAAPDPDSVSDSLARAAELGLAEMSEPGRDPREAIIACYIAMEKEFATAPDAAPHASDTPSEVLARAVDHGVLHSDAAAELVGLFAEARFSSHEMFESQRDTAVRLLRMVSDDVRSSS